ncbi:DUF3558 domain-containing protein [Rhodococcus sp. SGAir0479]|uniref:DUF3558 domain-containing protein n=1 Tax=Rhodococcus sp. SGAir0479 TaxID=2567884 RepID=UPI0010CD2EA3|nr:DUF3558 domain-containing protein [Rhodococcus sp. SGAir0479]QCQ92241.1 DUF3558 domain-containing protein [Rhodococcus sp. SGAir0479]
MTRRAVRWFAVPAAALVLAGCGATVPGTPMPAGASGAGGDYVGLLTECEAVAAERIADAVGGGAIERGFFGAVCRWSVDGPAGPVRVTFDWFESGSLDVERETARRLGYAPEDVVVDGRRAVLVRQPHDPGSCGVAVGAPAGGVVGWWAQYRAPGHPDPCEAAVTLAKLTLDLSA